MSEMQDLLYWLHDCKKGQEELDKIATHHNQYNYHEVATMVFGLVIQHIEKRMGHVLTGEGMRKLHGWD